jgi:2-methylisocitrate lyase-like PEP mutase family enzyme
MTIASKDDFTSRAAEFRRLHVPGKPLLLPNAWDAGSARLIESCGAAAIATTSAGVAWSHGYPDGDALPPAILAAAVAEIARVLSVPLTADIEGGYSADPTVVGETVAAVVDAGAVGINLEDGSGSPELLCAKIAAAKTAAARAGVDLFVNARTDVYLKGLVPHDGAEAQTIERARRYRDAGCDGVFVPGLTDAATIQALATEIPLPLNVLVRPTLPPVAELAKLGVSRVSAGSAIAQTAYGIAQRAAVQLLTEGRYESMYETAADYMRTNALLSRRAGVD